MVNVSGRSWNFSVSIWAKVLEDCGISVYFLKGKFFSLFVKASNLAVGSTQLPISWIPKTLSRQWSGWRVNLTTHLHLVSILRVSEPKTVLPVTPWWRVRWLHYLCFSLMIGNFLTTGANGWNILGVWQKDFVHFFFLVCGPDNCKVVSAWVIGASSSMFPHVTTPVDALGFLHLRRSRSTISPSNKCISEIGK